MDNADLANEQVESIEVWEPVPDKDTPLKNKSEGERWVAISDDVAGVLSDWIDDQRPDVARSILSKLDKYEYASLPHALILILWRGGIRTGTVRALDLSDYHPDEQFLDIEHRAGTDTRLKNKKWGERKIALSEETCAVLDDYIDENRVEITDEHGREPLLTTKIGRIARNTVRKWCYRLTRPCWFDGVCPKDRALRSAKRASRGVTTTLTSVLRA